MSEPRPIYIVPDPCVITGPCNPSPQTPTYDDLLHYADVGRRLTVEAGYPLDARPPAAIVLRALLAKGLLVAGLRYER